MPRTRFCVAYLDQFWHAFPIATTFIYSLADPRPGDTHVYIGKADKPRLRLNEHRCRAKSERTYKANWFRQLAGLSLEPVLEVLVEVPFYQWQIWEVTFIHWYRVLGWNVVNATDGGDGGAQDMTPETCAKISKANKGKKWSEEAKRRFRELHERIGWPSTGKKLSPEHKSAISAVHKGKKKSAQTRARMSTSAGKHLKGKTQSAEHIAKCRAAKLGKKFTPEHSAKIGAALKGKSKSAEARARMSIAAKARCARNKLRTLPDSAFVRPLL